MRNHQYAVLLIAICVTSCFHKRETKTVGSLSVASNTGNDISLSNLKKRKALTDTLASDTSKLIVMAKDHGKRAPVRS